MVLIAVQNSECQQPCIWHTCSDGKAGFSKSAHSHVILLDMLPGRDESQGLLVTFFGKKGQDQLDLKHFAAFCTELHAELVRLEFLHYDIKGQVCVLSLSVPNRHHCQTESLLEKVWRSNAVAAGVHLRDKLCAQLGLSLQHAEC
jgi:hypothetical protein